MTVQMAMLTIQKVDRCKPDNRISYTLPTTALMMTHGMHPVVR
jgi:hypothetical protein